MENSLVLSLDNTYRKLFKQCPRKYFFEREQDLRPETGSTALRYGVVWHAVMEGFYKHIMEHGYADLIGAMSAGLIAGQKSWNEETEGRIFYDDYRNMQSIADALRGYMDYFITDKDNLEILASERIFKVPIVPKPGKQQVLYGHLPQLIYKGKLDLTIKLNMSPWNHEFKTTSYHLSMQAQKLHRDPQFLGYTHASREVLDFKTQGLLVSFLHTSARKSPKTGEYGKVKLDYLRIPQIYSEKDVESWRVALLAVYDDVFRAMETENYPMNHDSCYTYGTCSFARLCEQNEEDFNNLNLEGYIVKPWEVDL